MKLVDPTTGARGFQTDVEMRDGIHLNTFVFLPAAGGPQFPVILQRTPIRVHTLFLEAFMLVGALYFIAKGLF